MTPLVLASTSQTRIFLLTEAGLQFTARAAAIDERAIATPLLADGHTPGEVALALAGEKALAVSRLMPKAMVIGADQALDFDGAMWTKPANLAAARKQLVRLSGRTHRLESAVAVAQAGVIRWRHVESAALAMRALTTAEIDNYLMLVQDAATESVGAYQVEGVGIQLFDRIEGEHTTVLGLPMLPLLAFLREQRPATKSFGVL
jgi:septum formation protein